MGDGHNVKGIDDLKKTIKKQVDTSLQRIQVLKSFIKEGKEKASKGLFEERSKLIEAFDEIKMALQTKI